MRPDRSTANTVVDRIHKNAHVTWRILGVISLILLRRSRAPFDPAVDCWGIASTSTIAEHIKRLMRAYPSLYWRLHFPVLGSGRRPFFLTWYIRCPLVFPGGIALQHRNGGIPPFSGCHRLTISHPIHRV